MYLCVRGSGYVFMCWRYQLCICVLEVVFMYLCVRWSDLCCYGGLYRLLLLFEVCQRSDLCCYAGLYRLPLLFMFDRGVVHIVVAG